MTGKPEFRPIFLEGAKPRYPRMANFSFDYGNSYWTVLDANTYMDWSTPFFSRLAHEGSGRRAIGYLALRGIPPAWLQFFQGALPRAVHAAPVAWGRADFDQRHRFNMLGSFSPGRRVTLGLGLTLNSGAPYTMTTGTDAYHTGMSNARPPDVARNTLQGPGYADVDLRLARDFYLNPAKKDKGAVATVAMDAFNFSQPRELCRIHRQPELAVLRTAGVGVANAAASDHRAIQVLSLPEFTICAETCCDPGDMRLWALAWIASLLSICHGQLTVGAVEGTTVNAAGSGAPAHLEIQEASGWTWEAETDPHGRYSLVLPYGLYTIHAIPLASSCSVKVLPLQTAHCDIHAGRDSAVTWPAVPAGAYSAPQVVMFQTPAVVTDPLNFAGLGLIRRPMLAGWPASWTLTTFHLNGMDGTDSYQPGRPAMLDDIAAETAITYREAYAARTGALHGVDLGIYLRGGQEAWHGGLATDDTGSAFAADHPERFRYFTRDTAAISGPITRWADVTATGTAQWASQTAPLRPDRTSIGSRMLFGNIRGRVHLGSNQFDGLYSGSRLDLDSGGWPAALEATFASRMMPTFYGVAGFENLRETDHLDLMQAGWTHQFGGRFGVLEARYQYSTAHLDTSAIHGANAPVIIDMLDPAPFDAPVSNLAIRTRHQIEAAWQSARRFTVVAGWQEAQPRNRFHLPPHDFITAAGQPAYNVRFHIPAETSVRIDSFTASAADSIRLRGGFIIDATFVLDGARGGAIAWTSPSPHIGLAAPVPRFARLTLRGNYARTYARLAGRYLDFADPQSLTALVYDPSGRTLLQRFGGAYSAIAPGLKRPYADEFDVAAELVLPRESAFSVRLLRRDEKNRIAAANVGVPPSAYQPVVIVDPGPDALPGTFDDQVLTVYSQSPATLGQDRYLLTNPAGLRELSEALIAAASTRLSVAEVHASFTAVKSWGPTNRGNSAWANDPGVIGNLYSDPNSLINARGHPFMDRAFIGKFQALVHAPGGFEISNIINYLDGLPFARQLLIAGFPQGPFLVNATIRGSPEGGNRAQYVLNWNLRIERNLHLRLGQFTVGADLLNVLNNANKIVESDLTGPQFNQRPALALPPPRTVRMFLHWAL